MKNRFEELGTLIALLIPISFIAVGGYLQYVTGFVLLFLIQGYVAWFLYFKSGQPFFGYSVSMGLGAYATVVLNVKFAWPLWAGMLVGALLATLVLVAIFLVTSRARGFYVSMASFLLAVLFPQLVLALFKITGGHSGLYFDGLPSIIGANSFYLIIIFSAVAIALVLMAIMRSKTGAILTLITENDSLAQAMGINTFRYKVLAYAIAGFLSGLGGGLYVNYTGYISATDIEVFTTVYIFFIPLIGGYSKCYGPLIGALVVILAPEMMADLERYIHVLMGALFITVVMLLPHGIALGLENAVVRLFRSRWPA